MELRSLPDALAKSVFCLRNPANPRLTRSNSRSTWSQIRRRNQPLTLASTLSRDYGNIGSNARHREVTVVCSKLVQKHLTNPNVCQSSNYAHAKTRTYQLTVVLPWRWLGQLVLEGWMCRFCNRVKQYTCQGLEQGLGAQLVAYCTVALS
jgi:hypothetical protein